MFDLLFKMKESNILSVVHENTILTYKQLFDLVCRNKKYLKSCGYHSGDCVVIQVQSQLEFVITTLSMLSLETKVVTLTKEFAFETRENIINLTGARVMSEEEVAFCMQLHNVVAEECVELPDEKKTIIYHVTSGSTGKPKLCERTLDYFSLESNSFQQIFDLKAGTKIMSLCPLEHSFAAGLVLFNCFNFGGTLCLIESFNPKKVMKAIISNSVEYLAMVPSMMRVLSKLRWPQEALNIQRHIIVGSGILQKEVAEEIEKNLNCRVHSNYGSSESGCVITSREKWKAGSAGVAMPGVTLKLCDDDYNTVTKENESGKLYIKCDWRFSGYWDNKDLFTEDGFMTLGDIARIDSEGYVYILGRSESFAKINGKKVNCIEVENKIKTIPYITDCKIVIGKKHNQDEYIIAFTEISKQNKDDVRREIYSVLDKIERPEKIINLSSFPRNSMGKIIMDELRKMGNIDV